MNAESKTANQVNPIDTRLKLAALWAAMMLAYVYGDILSLFRPGQLGEMMNGRMGPFPVTQGSLLTTAVLTLIPALMIFASVALRAGTIRWANIVLGVVYTLVNISNLIGENWAYYIFIGLAEIALTVLIVWHAWTWRNPEG